MLLETTENLTFKCLGTEPQECEPNYRNYSLSIPNYNAIIFINRILLIIERASGNENTEFSALFFWMKDNYGKCRMTEFVVIKKNRMKLGHG